MKKPTLLRLGGLLACLLTSPLAALAGEAVVEMAPTPVVRMGTTGAEEPFRDPFETESESAEASQVKICDPLEPLNRSVFKFNDRLYFWFLQPLATGYKTVAPRPFRECVGSFFLNLKFPVRLANNLLEGKPKGAAIETTRFLVNTTLGVGGLFDPASRWKLKPQPANFDQTLGCYRIPTGCYIVWPFLGPASLRSTVGMAGDAALSPWLYLDGADWTLAARPAEILNSTSLRLGEYEAFKKANLDPYVSMRSSFFEYWQNRDKK